MIKEINAIDWILIDVQDTNTYPPIETDKTIMMVEPDKEMGIWWVTFPGSQIINERIDRVAGQYWILIDLPIKFDGMKVVDISIG